jgi:hypothetical protein
MVDLGVVPATLGVHLVPLPVNGTRPPWDNGVYGRLGSGLGV